MYTEPLDRFPLWLLLAAAVALFLLAVEIGYRFGRWRHARSPGERDTPVGAMVGSILGLLALVLGFTFSLAASRFDARRQVVLEEANAIGTAYLRARLLPKPQRNETARLLREYADVRLRGVETGHLAEALSQSEVLHEHLWTEATAAADADGGSIMTGLFIQSLNEVIDLHAKRVQIGVRSRIPWIIWLGLNGLALVSMGAVGYQAGLSATARSPAMLGLVLAFAFVLFLIADLDRGHEGLLQVSQQAMVDLQESMQAPLNQHSHRETDANEHSALPAAVSN
jgi:hypothetical protein